jgi:hypothetical protein
MQQSAGSMLFGINQHAPMSSGSMHAPAAPLAAPSRWSAHCDWQRSSCNQAQQQGHGSGAPGSAWRARGSVPHAHYPPPPPGSCGLRVAAKGIARALTQLASTSPAPLASHAPSSPHVATPVALRIGRAQVTYPSPQQPPPTAETHQQIVAHCCTALHIGQPGLTLSHAPRGTVGQADFDLVVDCAPTTAGTQLLQALTAAPTFRMHMPGNVTVVCPVTLSTDLNPAVSAATLVFIVHDTFLCRMAVTGFTKTVLQEYGYNVQAACSAQPVPAPSSSPTTVAMMWEHRGAPPRGLASSFPAGMYHVVVATVVPPASDPTLSKLPREWLGKDGKLILTVRVEPPDPPPSPPPPPPHSSPPPAAASSRPPPAATSQATPPQARPAPPAASPSPAQHPHHPPPSSALVPPHLSAVLSGGLALPCPSQRGLQPGFGSASGRAPPSAGVPITALSPAQPPSLAPHPAQAAALGAEPMQCDSPPTSNLDPSASCGPLCLAQHSHAQVTDATTTRPVQCALQPGMSSSPLPPPIISGAAPDAMQCEPSQPCTLSAPQWSYGVASNLYHLLLEEYEDHAIDLGGGEAGARRVRLIIIQAMAAAADARPGAWRKAQLGSVDSGGDGRTVPKCLLLSAQGSAAKLFQHPPSLGSIPVTVQAFLAANLPGLQLGGIPELAATRSTLTSTMATQPVPAVAPRLPAKAHKVKKKARQPGASMAPGEQAAADHGKRHQGQEPGTPRHEDKRPCSPARQRQAPGRPHPPAPDPASTHASQPPPAAPGPAGSGTV